MSFEFLRLHDTSESKFKTILRVLSQLGKVADELFFCKSRY